MANRTAAACASRGRSYRYPPSILPVSSRFRLSFLPASSRFVFRCLPGILPDIFTDSSRYPSGFSRCLTGILPVSYRVSLLASSRYPPNFSPGIFPVCFPVPSRDSPAIFSDPSRDSPAIFQDSSRILPGLSPGISPLSCKVFPGFSQILSAVTFSCGRRPAAAPARRRSGRPRRSGPSSASYAAGWEW